MEKNKLNVGDTITCSSVEEMKGVAADLVALGYKVDCIGWEGLRNNKLTITKAPEGKDEKV